jgi:lysophospholipase L1-like esterase
MNCAWSIVATLVVSASALAQTETRAARIRVACVGDSITEGTVLPERETNSYPRVLGRLLGSGFEVRNFGKSGATVVAGRFAAPYQTNDQFRQALAFSPDIVVVLLGTNDAKTNVWPNLKTCFPERYRGLLESFRCVLPHPPFVIACLPVPVYGEGRYGINEANRREVVEAIRAAATDEKVPVVDPTTVLGNHPEWFPDTVHPNVEGTEALARFIAEQIRLLNLFSARGSLL